MTPSNAQAVAEQVYSQLYIDEHGDVTTRERDIQIITQALAQRERETYHSILKEMDHIVSIEDDERGSTHDWWELYDWCRQQAKPSGEGARDE